MNKKCMALVGTSLAIAISLFGCGGGGGGGGGGGQPMLIAAPLNVRAIASDSPIIIIGWNASAGATSYNLYIATVSGVTKSNYSTLPGGMKLTGVNSPYTITGLEINTTYYAVVTAVNAGGESGESVQVQGMPTAGPGDVMNYFPITAGNTWTFSGTESTSTSPTTTLYTNVVTTGTNTINGVLATTFSQTNSENFGPIVDYLLKDSNGIISLGNNDATDLVTQQLVPYWLVKFPLSGSFVSTNMFGLDSGVDLDGDGINEKVDINTTVSVVSTSETVTVPAGSFLNVLHIDQNSMFTFHLSTNGALVTVHELQSAWYAPNVGPLKSVDSITTLNVTDIWTEVLTGSVVAADFFGPGTNFTAGIIPNFVTVGDFNGDGKLDLVVTNQGNPSLGFSDSSVSVLLGNGLGSFGSTTNFNSGTYPISIAVGDFNGDGKLDLAVANFGSDNVSVLLGNGDGTFGSATNYPLVVGMNPTSIAVGDFNGDGKLDLAVANSFGFSSATPGNVSILLGNGDGTFKSAMNFAVGGSPHSVAVGDFNGDGKLDLAVANSLGNSVSILLGNGDGTFGSAKNVAMAAGDSPISVVVRDFNGDGKLDLAVANNSPVVNNSNVSILLGDGTGSFSALTQFVVDSVAGANLTSMAVGDFNGDGKLDLAVTNSIAQGVRSNTVSIFLGDGLGSFSGATYFVAVGGQPASVAVGDFNGDGKLDMAVVNNSNVSVFLHTTP
jgi:uncharacterized protein (DUF2141 family)